MTKLENGWFEASMRIGRRLDIRANLGLAVMFGMLLANMVPASADELGVKLVSITSPVPHGETTTLVVQTEPGAACSGAVRWVGVKSSNGQQNAPLIEKKSNNQGMAQWTWRVSGVAGHRTVDINCSAGDRKGTLQAGFDVT
jgi:hypothetical protein